MSELDKLCKENEELRELVRDMFECEVEYALEYCDEDGITIGDAIKWAERDRLRRARDLGIEVDG